MKILGVSRLLFVFLCLFLCCNTLQAQTAKKERTTARATTKPRIPFQKISLNRTGCYGTCPSYKIVVYSKGVLVYKGLKYVETVGPVRSSVTKKQVNLLAEALSKAKYLKLQSSYRTEKDGCRGFSSDNPTITLSVRTVSRTKTIKHYLGCYATYGAIGPQLRRLEQLEKQIVEILNIAQWVGKSNE